MAVDVFNLLSGDELLPTAQRMGCMVVILQLALFAFSAYNVSEREHLRGYALINLPFPYDFQK